MVIVEVAGQRPRWRQQRLSVATEVHRSGGIGGGLRPEVRLLEAPRGRLTGSNWRRRSMVIQRSESQEKTEFVDHLCLGRGYWIRIDQGLN